MSKETKQVNDLEKLDTVLTDLQKKFGKGSIALFGKNTIKVERVPLSSMNLTRIFGGGCPRGRIIEVYGAESSGKTSLAELLASDYQHHFFEDKNRYGRVAYIDVEHAFDPEYARIIGVDIENLIFSQPDSAEQALDMVEALVNSDLCDLIVVDSVAALTPMAEIDGGMGDQQMALRARLMSKACGKLSIASNPTSATILFINQTRQKIGAMVYGNPETTTGGNALRFYASVRLTTRRKEYVGAADAPEGIVTVVKAIKNKVATPFRSCEVKLLFGKGYQVEEEFISAFVERELVQKGGSWYTIPYTDKDGKQLSERVQGLERVIEFFKTNPEVFEAYKEKIHALIEKETSVTTLDQDKEEDKEAIDKQQEKLEKEALEGEEHVIHY